MYTSSKNERHGPKMHSNSKIIIIPIIILCILVVIQIFSLEHYHFKLDQSPGWLHALKDDLGRHHSREKKVPDPTSLRSFEEILQKAGVDVTDEIRDQFPPIEDVASMYGSEPIILGLERCETFRNTVVKGDGFIAPAGIFNTVSKSFPFIQLFYFKVHSIY